MLLVPDFTSHSIYFRPLGGKNIFHVISVFLKSIPAILLEYIHHTLCHHEATKINIEIDHFCLFQPVIRCRPRSLFRSPSMPSPVSRLSIKRPDCPGDENTPVRVKRRRSLAGTQVTTLEQNPESPRMVSPCAVWCLPKSWWNLVQVLKFKIQKSKRHSEVLNSLYAEIN